MQHNPPQIQNGSDVRSGYWSCKNGLSRTSDLGALPPSRTNGDGNGGQQNGQRHPKLDMRAENVEPFDKHLQDRSPG